MFKKNKIICIVDKDDYETDEQYYERGYFISNNNPKNKSEYDKLLLYSRIYRNVNYYKCVYDERIMNQLNTFKI